VNSKSPSFSRLENATRLMANAHQEDFIKDFFLSTDKELASVKWSQLCGVFSKNKC